MNAWLLAALLCMPASAAVVETGGTIAPVAPISAPVGSGLGSGADLSPIALVPGGSLLAPSLNVGALFKVPGQGATILSAGAARLAASPVPVLPASAAAGAPGAAREGAPADAGGERAKGDPLPPFGADRQASSRTAAGGPRRELSAPLDAAGLSSEDAVAAGRKTFDRSGDRARLADGSAAGTPGASVSAAPSSETRDPLLAASAGGGAPGEPLRDAVASPIPAGAAPGGLMAFFRVPGSPLATSRSAAGSPAAGAAPVAAAPITFERLSLELGAGLVVKVRAAMGLSPAAATPAPLGGAAKGARADAARNTATSSSRVPVTSTEWLERRGLLESISASEAAASQQAASLPVLLPELASVGAFSPASRTRSARAAAPVLDLRIPARGPALGWWALALLPVLLVLLNEFL
ncbi:MAG: hypothetical protein ACHQ2Z_13455 [Elusimicrobiota bacterium]